MAENSTVTKNNETGRNQDMETSMSAKLVRYLAICETLNVLVLATTLWITVCLIVHGRRTKKWNLSSISGKIHVSCFVAVLLTLPDIIVVLTLFHVSDIPGARQYCELMLDIGNATGTIALLGTYLFLWVRQRAIYSNSFVKALHGKAINVISWALLGLIILSFVLLASAYIIPISFTSNEVGCITIPKEHVTKTNVNWQLVKGLDLGFNISCQIVLLAMFVYPMLRIKRASNSFCRAHSHSQRDKISSTILRCTICAAIVISSDITAEIFLQTLPLTYPGVITGTIYGLDVLIDVFCMIATFDDYRQILSALCRGRNQKARSPAENSCAIEQSKVDFFSFH